MDPRLVDWLASVTHDPHAFVLGAFPWGEAGTALEKFSGPEPWQVIILNRIRDGLPLGQAIQLATASGHGVGKSALVAWIILWSLSTLPDTKVVVTANTEPQLKTKTWPETAKWFNLFLGKELFKFTATAIFSVDQTHEKTWRADIIPWSENNPEAFAGLHNQGRRIVVIFDEASAIADCIWETTEGALTDADTEILWIVFGNPTRSTGRFKECFPAGKFASVWQTYSVDSRTISFTNKAQITRWIEAYGEDSDFVRIRVKGQFPKSGEMEFFSAFDVDAAMLREATFQPTDPLAIGVDVARFGSNNSVLFPRKGRDARSIQREVYQGLDTVALATKVFEMNDRLRADGIFVDGGGVGGGVVDNIRRMQLFCFEVQFGAKNDIYGLDTGNPGEKYANKRAGMYGAVRAWLKTASIPNEPDLRSQLLSITYTLNPRDEIVLTSKEVMMREGKPSPDDVDALATTFAFPLAKNANAGSDWPKAPLVESDYNPFDKERMAA